MSKSGLVRVDAIEHAILRLRGCAVLLDEDLARLYQVDVKVLNQAVKRNRGRFPADFMFHLNAREVKSLRSQNVTLKAGRGRHRKYPPAAFTEQGVAMLSSVLRSSRAVRVNIQIMRAFVRLRHVLASNAALAKKLSELEAQYDEQFEVVFDALRDLMRPPPAARKRIGFRFEPSPGRDPRDRADRGLAETR